MCVSERYYITRDHIKIEQNFPNECTLDQLGLRCRPITIAGCGRLGMGFLQFCSFGNQIKETRVCLRKLHYPKYLASCELVPHA